MDGLSPEQIDLLASEDQGPKIITIVVALTVLSFVFVVLRFFTRIKFTSQLGSEDYLIAVSMVFAIITAALQVSQVKHGGGKHRIFVPLPMMMDNLKFLYWTLLANVTAFTLIKVSICMQYRRIFSVTDARIPIYVVTAICIAGGISAFLTFAFTCIPVDAFWNVLDRPTSKCINENANTFIQGTLNAVTDIMVAALPIRAIWRLQLERRQKIALIGIMTIGWCVCIVSCIRLNSLVVLSRHPDDTTFFVGPVIYLAALEMNLAIVCACVPTLRPLIIRIVPDLTSRRSGPTASQHTASSRWSRSKLGRSFKKLDGSDNSGAVPANTRRNSGVGTELGPVGALLPVYSQESNDEQRIRITKEVRMQSSQASRGTSILDVDEADSTRGIR